MNRLILIGNGFDLAHGLKTSYADFIYWYWKRRVTSLHDVRSSISDDSLCTIEVIGEIWSTFYWQQANLLNRTEGKDLYNFLNKHKDKFTIRYTAFFGNIHKSIETKGWVDIENEYYKLLEQYTLVQYSEEEITKLNKQLAYLQELLTEYLLKINQQDISVNDNIKKKIYEPVDLSDISVEATDKLAEYIKWCKEQDVRDWEIKFNNYCINPTLTGLISKVENYNRNPSEYNQPPSAFMLPDAIMLLDFNYTKTAQQYLLKNNGVFSHIHIHGHLENPTGMIFGYGDEFDDKYRRLQALNNNECLANIKTIKYQESDNYRRVLQFIESAPFQVYIMGHSCGNSDRTLLNTIFEHDNCISIKPFFYKKEDGSDSYIETIQNISRNFNDMKLMRDRVVNKLYCETLTE